MENDHEITFRNELKVSRPIVEYSKEVDRKEVIKGLEYTKEMITFNPLTGEEIEPENLNEVNKITYDACVGAIALLNEHEEPKEANPRLLTPEEVKTTILTCTLLLCVLKLQWHRAVLEEGLA